MIWLQLRCNWYKDFSAKIWDINRTEYWDFVYLEHIGGISAVLIDGSLGGVSGEES